VEASELLILPEGLKWTFPFIPEVSPTAVIGVGRRANCSPILYLATEPGCKDISTDSSLAVVGVAAPFDEVATEDNGFVGIGLVVGTGLGGTVAIIEVVLMGESGVAAGAVFFTSEGSGLTLVATGCTVICFSGAEVPSGVLAFPGVSST
tara:strand:- start:308 stop:757 length:450 start_codon:yes stop_codon:yes gene_type:complete